jgi:hypothetical protein
VTVISNPKFLLFAQHGWADTGKNIGNLARTTANSQTLVIAPSLGLFKTFIRIEPLVGQIEQIAAKTIAKYPHTPIKIIGHSMGGLIWLEVLNRNPQWWSKIHSFILLGSPVGGSNIARIIDPLNLGIGIAADLGKNRRDLAEKIARHIPTLSVASDIGSGTDGLVTVENTKFDYANWLLISGVPHDAMRYHPKMIAIVKNFWANPQLGWSPEESIAAGLIRRLRSLPGMTDADYRNFKRSQIIASFPENITLRTLNQPWGVNYVYLGQQQQCRYAGYVGLVHSWNWRSAIAQIQKSTS